MLTHQNLGLSEDNPLFGSVKISHNDVPAKSLFISSVILTNDSNRDITGIQIDISCDQQSLILVAHGSNLSTLKYLNFSDKYTKMLTDDHPINDLSMFRFREFAVPVFNRGDQVMISALVSNDVGTQPNVTVSCEHPGVKLRIQKRPPQIIFGESSPIAFLIGILLSIIACYFLIESGVSVHTGVWISFVLGTTCTVIGVIIIKMLRLIKKYLL